MNSSPPTPPPPPPKLFFLKGLSPPLLSFSLFFFSLSLLSLSLLFSYAFLEKQVWSSVADWEGFSIIFGVIRNGIREREMREKGKRASWEWRRTWALMEQSCLWRAKWRSYSISIYDQRPGSFTKCLFAMQTHLLSCFLSRTKGLCIPPTYLLFFFRLFSRCPQCWILCGINGLLNLWMCSQYAPNRWCVVFFFSSSSFFFFHLSFFF